MYDTVTGNIVFADVDHTDDNNVSITFAVTPTNDIRVVFIDAKDGLSDITPTYS